MGHKSQKRTSKKKAAEMLRLPGLIKRVKPKVSTFKTTRFSKTSLAAFVLVFAAFGSYFLLVSHAATGTANIFVSTTGTTCTRFAAATSFPGDSQACGSLLSACQLAQGGDTVMIENGTYSGSTLDSCTGKSSLVTFTTEPGQGCTYSAATPFASLPGVNADTSCPVTFSSELSIRGNSTSTPATSSLKNMKFVGMYFSDVYIRYAYNISLDHSQGHFWFVRSADTINITNGDWGNQFDGTCATIGSMGSGTPATTNITVTGNIFHDLRRDISPTTHPDGLFVQESNGVTISNNVFYRNDVIPLYINSIFNGLVQNITITNNVIHTSTDHISGSIGPAVSTGNTNTLSLGNNGLVNATVAYNTVSGAIRRQESPGPTTNLKVYGNVASEFIEENSAGCSPSGTYDYNVWYLSGAVTCGTHDAATGTDPFVSDDVMPDELTLGDLQDKSGSAPIDFIPTAWCSSNPGICPSTDSTGVSRPQGGAYDAGAYEQSVTTPVANLWVDTNGGTCTRQATAAVYSDSAACGSFQAAYAAAQPGDLVLVKCGSYGSQTLTDAGHTNPNNVTIEAEQQNTTCVSASVTANGADHVTIAWMSGQPQALASSANCSAPGAADAGCTTDVTFDHFSDQGTFYITGPTSNVTIKHSEFGPWMAPACWAGGGNQIKSDTSGGTSSNQNEQPTDTYILGNYIHDIDQPNHGSGCSPTPHMDCFHVLAHTHIEIMGNIIENCLNYGLLLNSNYSLADENDVIEDNWFGASFLGFKGFFLRGGATVTDEEYSNVTIAYNSATNSIGACSSGACTTTNVIFKDNVATDLNYCASGTYQNNRMTDPAASTCAGTRITSAQAGFINTTYPIDLHINSSSVLSGAGEASGFPAHDIDYYNPWAAAMAGYDGGETRLSPAAIGSDEYITGGGSCPAGDVNGDCHVTITDLSILLSHYSQPATASQGDCNSDGTVTVLDLSILLSHYGT